MLLLLPCLPVQHTDVVAAAGTLNSPLCQRQPPMRGSWNRMEPSGTKGGTKANARIPQAKPPCAGRGTAWNQVEPRAEPRQMPALPKRNLHVRVVEPRGTKWNQGRNQSKCPHSPRETSMCGSWNQVEPSGTKGGTKANVRTP